MAHNSAEMNVEADASESADVTESTDAVKSTEAKQTNAVDVEVANSNDVKITKADAEETASLSDDTAAQVNRWRCVVQ